MTPYAWNPERRSQFCAELDTYYAHLCGLTRNEPHYILEPATALFGPGGTLFGTEYPNETFRDAEKNEERAFGDYRSRRLVLEAWNSMAH